MDDPDQPLWKVPRRLRANAKTLRRNQTDAERILWHDLRNHRLNGFAFRRQVPIGAHIADFVCHAARLVVELDGGQHFSDDGEHADARRTAAIEARGFRVLRFSNHDVMTNRSGVLEIIAATLAASAPTPTLPRKRERGAQCRSERYLFNFNHSQVQDFRRHDAGLPPLPRAGEGRGGGDAALTKLFGNRLSQAPRCRSIGDEPHQKSAPHAPPQKHPLDHVRSTPP